MQTLNHTIMNSLLAEMSVTQAAYRTAQCEWENKASQNPCSFLNTREHLSSHDFQQIFTCCQTLIAFQVHPFGNKFLLPRLLHVWVQAHWQHRSLTYCAKTTSMLRMPLILNGAIVIDMKLAEDNGNCANRNYSQKPAVFGLPPKHQIGKHEAYFPSFTRASSKHIFLILKILDHVK